jgi:hypothetical protein
MTSRVQNRLAGILSAAALLALVSSAALAEVKEGDPGATCTNSTETINGQSASCKSCTATKCDTSGNTVSNCRKETTKTCTIGGKVVNPGGGGLKGNLLNRAPGAMKLYKQSD